jgi:hypothetical protein
MRSLNNKEKEIVDAILLLRKNDYVTLFMVMKTLLNDFEYKLDFNGDKFKCYIPGEDIDRSKNFRRIESFMLSSKTLLKLLQNEGLIDLYTGNKDFVIMDHDKVVNGEIDENKTPSFIYFDKEIYEYFHEVIYKQIIVYEDFKYFKNNNYLTNRDKREITNLNLAKTALLLSVIIGLLSFGYDRYEYYKGNSNNLPKIKPHKKLHGNHLK